jgi:hypothetical protein
LSLRAGRAALLAGAVLHILFVASLFGQFLNPLFPEAQHSFGQAADYFGIYTAGEDLIHGRSVYSGFEDHSGALRKVPYFYFYRYLPPTAYLSAPATLLLSPWAGYVLWVVVTEILLGWAVWSILRLEAFPIRERRFHAGLWLGFFPFYLEQWMGQFSFLMAVFLWILLRPDVPGRYGTVSTGSSLAGREAPDMSNPAQGPMDPASRGCAASAVESRFGGGAFGAARSLSFWAWAASVALKSYTALFAISLIRRRQIRPVLLCAGSVLLVCAPYWIAHPPDVQKFLLLNFRPLPPSIHGGTLGLSALVRLLGWSLPADLAGKRMAFGSHDVSVGNLPVFVVGMAVLSAALWAVMRHGKKTPMDLQFSLWVLCFFLIFKDIWEYHYVMLLPIVTAISLSCRSRFVLWVGLLLAVPTPYILLVQGDGTLPAVSSVIHHASKAVPALALFIWVLRRCATPSDGPSPSSQRSR